MIDYAAIEKDIATTLGWTPDHKGHLQSFRLAYMNRFGLTFRRLYPTDGHDDSWVAMMPWTEGKCAATGRTIDECTANFIEAEWERLTDAESEERRAIFFPVYAIARGE